MNLEWLDVLFLHMDAGFLMPERICDLCFTFMYTMWNDTGFNTKTQTSKNRGQQQLEIVHPYKRLYWDVTC